MCSLSLFLVMISFVVVVGWVCPFHHRVSVGTKFKLNVNIPSCVGGSYVLAEFFNTAALCVYRRFQYVASVMVLYSLGCVSVGTSQLYCRMR